MSITDQWKADPSWPAEQQLLFRRLSERFATHLQTDEDPSLRHTEEEERQILEKISATESARRG